MKFFRLIATVFVLAFASQAFASVFSGIEVSPQANSIFMQRNDNVGVLYSFANTTDSRKCIEIRNSFFSDYVSVDFADESFCLNAGESTQIAASFRTIDAQQADYSASMIFFVDGDSFTVSLGTVLVSEDSPSLEIIPYPTDVCRGEEEFINVLVRNKTSSFKTITLNAESEILLPSFEQSQIYLDAFQEKNIRLSVHTSRLSQVGKIPVSIYVSSGTDYIKRTVPIFVKDCEGIIFPSFELSLPSGSIAVEKTVSSRIFFQIRNLSKEAQTINAAVLSDLPTYLSNSSVSLDAFEERTLYFDVNARTSDSTGDHNISVIAWNPNNRVEKSKRIIVRPTSLPQVLLQNNNLSIRRSETGIFVFLAQNNGDTNSDFNFYIPNVPANMNAVFSDPDFSLNKNTAQEVYLFVSVAEAAALGDYDLNVIIKSGRKTFFLKPVFTVLEKAGDLEQELAIESYPLQIQAYANSQQNISVKLRNNSETIFPNVGVSLKNLPEQITSNSFNSIIFNPSESKNIQLSLSIGNIPAGSYPALLEVRNGNETATRQLQIVILSREGAEGAPFGGFGLFTLGESLALGLVVLIILLLAAIAVTGFAASNSEKEKWAENRAIRKI
ncbi:MAG TPA: hypothetical protein VI977_06855 [archaeon]|nr:hypothetical protein [archaeon]